MVEKRHSLVIRIALPFALLLLLTMGGLGLYLSSFIQETYLEILGTTLTSEARLVADRLSVVMAESPGDTAGIDERIKAIASELDVRVTVIDPQGRVLGESYTVASEMENHLDRPEIQRALRNEVSAEQRYSDSLQNEMLYAAAPVLVNGEVIGVARLAISLRAINRSERALMNSILLATAVATGLAILLAILVTNYAIAPLKELTKTAHRIAGGEPAEIPPLFRRDEIGTLHRAFRNMAQQVKGQIGALQTERAKLEIVLANMTDGVMIVDAEGIVQLANPAALRLFHAPEEGAVQKRLIEVIRHHQLVELWRKSNLTLQQQNTTLELPLDRVFLQGIATPLHGSLPGMTLMVFQDLTRVRKLETVRRDFVSNVSHELRTPLASLKALAETLQEGALEDPPAARRFLQRMDTEIDNLTQMVEELLELSRIESNRVPLQRTAISALDLLRPAVERMQLQAQRAGLTLRLECTGELPEVNADPQRIEHVLVNLIHNAIKFTPPGGLVVACAYEEQHQVVFSIRDTGTGISAEALPRIFERFYKADRSRSGGGTGLGLSIARHIIQAHGGRIWAESKENEGSTFYFSLPLA